MPASRTLAEIPQPEKWSKEGLRLIPFRELDRIASSNQRNRETVEWALTQQSLPSAEQLRLKGMDELSFLGIQTGNCLETNKGAGVFRSAPGSIANAIGLEAMHADLLTWLENGQERAMEIFMVVHGPVPPNKTVDAERGFSIGGLPLPNSIASCRTNEPGKTRHMHNVFYSGAGAEMGTPMYHGLSCAAGLNSGDTLAQAESNIKTFITLAKEHGVTQDKLRIRALQAVPTIEGEIEYLPFETLDLVKESRDNPRYNYNPCTDFEVEKLISRQKFNQEIRKSSEEGNILYGMFCVDWRGGLFSIPMAGRRSTREIVKSILGEKKTYSGFQGFEHTENSWVAISDSETQQNTLTVNPSPRELIIDALVDPSVIARNMSMYASHPGKGLFFFPHYDVEYSRILTLNMPDKIYRTSEFAHTFRDLLSFIDKTYRKQPHPLIPSWIVRRLQPRIFKDEYTEIEVPSPGGIYGFHPEHLEDVFNAIKPGISKMLPWRLNQKTPLGYIDWKTANSARTIERFTDVGGGIIPLEEPIPHTQLRESAVLLPEGIYNSRRSRRIAGFPYRRN